MMMAGNNSSGVVHYAAGRWPGRIGWLMGPTHWKEPRFYLPYALDNDAFAQREQWDEAKWLAMLDRARLCPHKPLWVLVPDSVGDRQGTLDRWQHYAPIARGYGWPLAFAVQDGMTPDDVPLEAQVVFVGGTTGWKWSTVETWVRHFPRVHVGRVNTVDRVWQCDDLGVESVDGTGWFRDLARCTPAPAFFEWLQGSRRPQQTGLQLTHD